MSHMYLGFILGVTGSVGLLRVNFVFFAALPSFVEQDFYIFLLQAYKCSISQNEGTELNMLSGEKKCHK